MSDDLEYRLLDLDAGRKLERFGAVTVVRPAPAAEGPADLDRGAWDDANAEFRRGPGGDAWELRRPLPDPWIVRSAGAEFLLEATPSGQVGLYPEQAELRGAIARIVRRAVAARPEPPRVLDLFGYTGGSAMALAAAGAEVTLVDSARGVVGWARRNFVRNGLDDAPIRSIAEDAVRFVQREARRGRRYDAVVLDPPTFGRGPKREVWKIDRDLGGLLEACRELLTAEPLFMLITAHTESWTATYLSARLNRALDRSGGRSRCGDLQLTTASGRALRAGIFALRELS